MEDHNSGCSRGFGFVRYETIEEATRGIEGMDGKVCSLILLHQVHLFNYFEYFIGTFAKPQKITNMKFSVYV